MPGQKSSLSQSIASHFGLDSMHEAVASVPDKYQLHDDCVVFDQKAFSHVFWEDKLAELWQLVASVLKVPKVAVRSVVSDDDFRSPNCRLVFGQDAWVRHKDNGIWYHFDVTKCMFSFGNISEKIRISKLDCQNDVIVDLFAGIGYFTLQYLVHARAHKVYACEWNPYSCEALRRSLILNKVEDERCSVLEGDNRKFCPILVANRVNLGLIPSCEEFYETACNALVKSGGILYIHKNVTTSGPNQDMADHNLEELVDSGRVVLNTMHANSKELVAVKAGLRCCQQLLGIMDEIRPGVGYEASLNAVYKVKNYAPRIQHFVFDVELREIVV